MPKVIANSTPLIILGNTGHIELLHQLYATLTIPTAVYSEVCAKDDDAARFLRRKPEWIHIKEAPAPDDLSLMSAKLHAGEIETIMLAKASQAELTIIDDNAAKKVASHLGLAVTGTLGVLVKAKQQGAISEVRPLMRDLGEAGFFVSSDVERLVLTRAGEA